MKIGVCIRVIQRVREGILGIRLGIQWIRRMQTPIFAPRSSAQIEQMAKLEQPSLARR